MDVAVVITCLVIVGVVALGGLAHSVFLVRSLVDSNERERQGWANALNAALDIRAKDRIDQILTKDHRL
jgi:hypothetical protein